MKNKIAKLTLKLTFLALMATALVAAPAVCRADDSTNAPATPAKKHSNALHGKVASVDANAMTFVVGESTIVVGSATKIMKDGQPAVFADIKEGENVSVAYKKDDAGKMNATSVRIGAKKAPKSDGAAPAPAAQ
jgi:hypothetical protein